MGGPPDSLFSLAPDWVYTAPSVTLRAVGSYPTFSPLSRAMRDGIFSVALAVIAVLRQPRPRFHGESCPLVSGLSSTPPETGQREPADRSTKKIPIFSQRAIEILTDPQIRVRNFPPKRFRSAQSRESGRRHHSEPVSPPGGPSIQHLRKPSGGTPGNARPAKPRPPGDA